MKHGQNNRRQRSRGNNNNRRYPNQRGNSFESNGPEVKVRGTAQQVLEKYQSLARDAFSSGDRVLAESYLQYAEHYYRVMNADAENKERENKERENNQNRDGGQNRDGNRNRHGRHNRDNAQANTESDEKRDEQLQSKDNESNAPEDVKTVEIKSAEVVSDDSAKSDASEEPANDAAPTEEAAPKKPRTRRPRKAAVAAEPVEQPQAGD